MANIGHKSQGNTSSNYTTVEPSDEVGKYVKIYVNSDEVQQKTIGSKKRERKEKKKRKKRKKKR